MKPDVPIINVLNGLVKNYICFATPSIPNDVLQKVQNIYDTDTSISLEAFGNPLLGDGVFGKAEELAAKAYGAKYTIFGANGTTGNNKTILDMLSQEYTKPNGGPCRILTPRNTHKSILDGAIKANIDLKYMPVRYNNDYQMFFPPTAEEVKIELRKDKTIDAVLLINPTYEGLSANLRAISEVVHDYDKVLFVDEAWGSHLKFTQKLPTCAMDSGADIATQSVHKQGGALQPGAVIHLNDERFIEATREIHYETSTSPSWHILASLDAAREYMQTKGKSKLNGMIHQANRLRNELNEIGGVKTLNKEICETYSDRIYDLDLTKVLANTGATGIHGADLAKKLENRSIVVEKYSPRSLLFLVTFQISPNMIDKAAWSLEQLVVAGRTNKQVKTVQMPYTIRTQMPHYDAYNMPSSRKQYLPLEKAKGRICAEEITPYPPGVPIIRYGEVFTNDMVAYLSDIRGKGNVILSKDRTLKNVYVLKA